MKRRPATNCPTKARDREFSIKKAKLLELHAKRMATAREKYEKDIKKSTDKLNTAIDELKREFGINR